MNRVFGLACTVASAAAVPISVIHNFEYSTTIDSAFHAKLDQSNQQALSQALLSAAGFESAQVELSLGHRRLQAGAVALKVMYTVACTSSCDTLTAKLSLIANDATAGRLHAQGIIDAVNVLARSQGFSAS